jgi:hypothetical protein
VLFTAEHWANFFLDHISPYCIGRAQEFAGPIERWLKIDKATLQGAPDLAQAILTACHMRATSSRASPTRCISTMAR